MSDEELLRAAADELIVLQAAVDNMLGIEPQYNLVAMAIEERLMTIRQAPSDHADIAANKTAEGT